MAAVTPVTDQDFATVVEGHAGLVLVDFWAEWCGPCRMVGPVVEELANDYGEKLKVVKLDVDSNQQTASKFGIMSIPALLLFKGGELVDRKVGAQPKGAMKAWIDEQLSG